jgi:hypothetical protein
MPVRVLLGATLLTASASLLLNGCSSSLSPTTTPALTSVTANARQAAHQRGSTFLGGSLFAERRHTSDRRAHTWFKKPQPPNPLLYVSDAYGNFVNIYSANGSGQSPVGQIAGFDEPQGLWVDINQNLWVVNTSTYQIMGFHRGSGVPFKTLNDTSGQSPAGVCGNDNKNLLYSLDISGPGSGYIGNTISVFKKNGSSDPMQTFVDPNASSLNLCAVDSMGNLFVTLTNVNYPYGGEVDEFPKGSTTPTVIANNFVYPIGITIDKYNAISVDDTFANGYSGGTIYIYDPPYSNGPAYSFPVPEGILQTALNKQLTQIWGASSVTLDAEQFSYPHGLYQNATSTQDFEYPDGIALSPAAKQ